MTTLKNSCICILLLVAAACKKEQVSPRTGAGTPATTVEAPSAAETDPKDSQDWAGSYKGTLPCGDCKGIKMNITIHHDNTYSLSVQALGKEDKPRIFRGTFYLDEALNVITLDAEGDHLKFKIQEESLVKLDKFGDPEQGGPAEAYILAKTAQ